MIFFSQISQFSFCFTIIIIVPCTIPPSTIEGQWKDFLNEPYKDEVALQQVEAI